ncbi:MAG: thioredoxin fold domain-containing protein, partial [Sedimenticola sp.]|nr:thioredoxin fold domain-containing protein [Sedimenticola sp.]
LKTVSSEPLALLFEDSSCDACNELHDGHLSNPDTLKILENFTFARLDANSEKAIIDPEGNTTTAKAYAEKLGLSYRPGIVLFDKGKEINRIDGLLYTYHFQEVLRYVGERHYVKYPKNFYDYLGKRTEEILKSGKSIDLSK